MFAILFDFFLLSIVDHHVESELPDNFQDIDFEELEQQQVQFEGKCP
jgi:hypothetical protein